MYSCGCASSVAFHVVVVLEFATSACASSERGRPSSGYREGPSCRLISRLASCALRMSAPRCSRLGQTALFSGAANNHVSRLGPAVQAAPPLCTHPLAAALEKWIMFLLRKCTLAKRIVVLDSRLFSPARATKPYRWHYLFRWRSLERGLSSGSCLRQGRSVESGRSSSRLFTRTCFVIHLFIHRIGWSRAVVGWHICLSRDLPPPRPGRRLFHEMGEQMRTQSCSHYPLRCQPFICGAAADLPDLQDRAFPPACRFKHKDCTSNTLLRTC